MSDTGRKKLNEARKVIKDYGKLLKKENFPANIYLFGSYAKGCSNKWSDLDIAVVSDKLKRNYWENHKKLLHLSLDIDRRLEIHSFTKKDFKNETDPMVYEIKKHGIRIV